MPEPASTTSAYTMGYDDDFLQMLHWRSAETHARHLLPHLKPGLSVLDFGCGPGTLSVGLARAVEPGEFHGVDIESSQIEMARAAAQAGGHGNASFQVADATDLPFDDSTFDVAHCHTVLNHVPDTHAVLAEVKRVLKPGGIISCRELIAASSFSEPAYSLAGAWDTFTKLVVANGGHPQIGKELKRRLLDTGFVEVRATASVDMFSTPEARAVLDAVITEWFFSPKVMGAAIASGLATQEQFDSWKRDQARWRQDPGAVGAIAFGEAIATKPS
ncbi:class I SAM-dependent methyltransferase [Candidatus Spongiisocius sp.]|uniref:class I SAM-dependent methyltransferase n=1 Tax=Candidatus Spongiisocius sp. TaxID=3101273 RepID=UPI003B5BDD66